MLVQAKDQLTPCPAAQISPSEQARDSHTPEHGVRAGPELHGKLEGIEGLGGLLTEGASVLV
jgi:hypothetical protein